MTSTEGGKLYPNRVQFGREFTAQVLETHANNEIVENLVSSSNDLLVFANVISKLATSILSNREYVSFLNRYRLEMQYFSLFISCIRCNASIYVHLCNSGQLNFDSNCSTFRISFYETLRQFHGYKFFTTNKKSEKIMDIIVTTLLLCIVSYIDESLQRTRDCLLDKIHSNLDGILNQEDSDECPAFTDSDKRTWNVLFLHFVGFTYENLFWTVYFRTKIDMLGFAINKCRLHKRTQFDIFTTNQTIPSMIENILLEMIEKKYPLFILCKTNSCQSRIISIVQGFVFNHFSYFANISDRYVTRALRVSYHVFYKKYCNNEPICCVHGSIQAFSFKTLNASKYYNLESNSMHENGLNQYLRDLERILLPHSFAIVEYHSKDFCKTKCEYPPISHIFLAFTLIGQYYYLQNNFMMYDKYLHLAKLCADNSQVPLRQDMYSMYTDNCLSVSIEDKFKSVMRHLNDYSPFYKESYGISTCPVVARTQLNADDVLFRGWRNMVSAKECNYCFEKGKKLSKCGGTCKSTFYCGLICQKRDWFKHKLVCKRSVN